MRSSTRVLSNRASRCSVHSSTPHSSGFRAPPQTGFRRAQLASACLRVAASAEAGAFLISPKKMSFSTGSQGLTLPTASDPAFKGGTRGCRFLRQAFRQARGRKWIERVKTLSLSRCRGNFPAYWSRSRPRAGQAG